MPNMRGSSGCPPVSGDLVFEDSHCRDYSMGEDIA